MACGSARNDPSSREANRKASCPALSVWKPPSSGDLENVATLGKMKRYDGPNVSKHAGAYEVRAVVGFGDCFVTGADGHAELELYGGGRVQLQPNTHACVLDAQPDTVFLVSGSLTGALDGSEPDEAIEIVMGTGALTLSGDAAARVMQRDTLSRGDQRLRSQAKLEMVRGQALLLRRTMLASDEPSFETVGIPCSLELDPAAPVAAENSLKELLARYEAEFESMKKDPQHVGTMRFFNLYTKVAAAADMSALEVLSGCATRGEREPDCSALTTWRHEQLPRLGLVWWPDHPGRGVQTRLKTLEE
ncbi:MAG: hypothetical protein JWN04_341 [Myxococcaceae bacterium]|nr:hypothetical protein [Myxococcaceae bacterium]